MKRYEGDEGEFCNCGRPLISAATRKAVDSEGWLDTGDIACVDSDGFVYIKDRCTWALR